MAMGNHKWYSKDLIVLVLRTLGAALLAAGEEIVRLATRKQSQRKRKRGVTKKKTK